MKSLVAEQVKDPALSLQWLGSLLWSGFDPWPTIAEKRKRKKKKKTLLLKNANHHLIIEGCHKPSICKKYSYL